MVGGVAPKPEQESLVGFVVVISYVDGPRHSSAGSCAHGVPRGRGLESSNGQHFEDERCN